MMNKLVLLAGVICLIIAISQAQTDYAALLRVERDGVEILRANTQVWISLPVGAETPFGVGDTVRTDFFGRAWITFLDDTVAFVLPTSQLTLADFSVDEDQAAGVHITQLGRIIYEIPDMTPFADFRIITPHLHLITPAEHFAVQTTEDSTWVVVASGEALVTDETENLQTSLRIGEGVGVRATEADFSPPIPLEYPTTFAQLDGKIDGCAGVIDPRNRENLNVRVGPTRNYDVIGTFARGDVVQLMGQSPNGERYRVVYKSHFGWILALEVRNACDNLPVYDYNTLERQYGVIAPSEDELRLLVPFFGLPEQDDWFYYGCDEDC
ncbi:MAG: SH3 domain-containing protein [bacterium]|nr:SH3 domain-containing protein [bacterium]